MRQKITDMTAIGALALTDILEVVDDPGGTPLSRKATMQQVATVVGTDTDIADAITKKHAQNTDTGTTQTSFTIDSGGAIVKKAATKTSAAISKTIGATGDYATHALAMAAVPDLLAHSVTHTIQAGTTIVEVCNVKNKHATVTGVLYTLQAEKYWPATASAIPTATAADATSLTSDAGTNNLKDAALADDYFNGCWIFVCAGTGTDNGFVAITDYDGTNGIVTVASWPGTTPDATSRFIIVGALISGASLVYPVNVANNSCDVRVLGIGVNGADSYGTLLNCNSGTVTISRCGVYGADVAGLKVIAGQRSYCNYSGLVGNNTDSSTVGGGVSIEGAAATAYITYNGISGNSIQGVYVGYAGYATVANNFGTGNGTWGTYAEISGQANCAGTECSGSSGDHSNAAGDGSLAY